MNILDENVAESQRKLLLNWGISIHQIGYDVGRDGMKDEAIIPLLHQVRYPTFFTQDRDFYKRELLHSRYCLVQIIVPAASVAIYVRRVLRHRDLNTIAKRMGTVIRVTPIGLKVWRLHAEQEITFTWDK